jgi:hypothetical protein
MTLMTTKKLTIAATVAAIGMIVLPNSVQAATLTQWNFNSLVPDTNTGTGTLTPNIGSGTVSFVGGVTNPSFNSGVGSSDLAADNSGLQTTTYPAQRAGNKTAGVQFNVSTVGQQNISIKFDQRHSNTSSRYAQLQYTTNGSTYTDFGSLFDANLGGDNWYNNRSINLSSIAGVNNNANFGFRIVSAFAPSTSTYAPSTTTSTYGTAGTWRFDMVTVDATPVSTPIPTPALVPGLIGFGLAALRKAKSEKVAV